MLRTDFTDLHRFLGVIPQSYTEITLRYTENIHHNKTTTQHPITLQRLSVRSFNVGGNILASSRLCEIKNSNYFEFNRTLTCPTVQAGDTDFTDYHRQL